MCVGRCEKAEMQLTLKVELLKDPTFTVEISFWLKDVK